ASAIRVQTALLAILTRYSTFGSQGRKPWRLCWTGLLGIRWFYSIADASELPDHPCSARLLRLLANSGTTFLVTNSLMKDQPDQSTLSMSNGPDGLIVS